MLFWKYIIIGAGLFVCCAVFLFLLDLGRDLYQIIKYQIIKKHKEE